MEDMWGHEKLGGEGKDGVEIERAYAISRKGRERGGRGRRRH
jgi:hypothetical protein